MREKQTIQRRSYPQEVGVEPRDKAEAQSIPPASEEGRNEKPEDQEEMLERILHRDNLNQAYNGSSRPISLD